MHETETCQVGCPLAINLRCDGHVMAPEKDLLGFCNPLFEKGWRDCALVDIEEGHIVVGHLMKKDDEFDKVGVRLLPEGFLPASEEIVQKRRDVIGKGVGVEIIVKRVIAVVRIEADFDVIV